MNKLIYILGIFILVTLLPSCSKDDSQGGTITPVTDVKTTPFYGSVILNWADPADKDYYYTMVSYVNAKGQKVTRKVSCYDADATGRTTLTIGGFTDVKSYDFTLTSYGFSGAVSKTVNISATPLSTDAAKDYILTTIKAVPAFEGAEVSWTNETGVENYVNISFTDGQGVNQVKKFKASTSGKAVVGSFMAATTITVTVENVSGSKSAARALDPVTPTIGELAKSQMSIASISSEWGGCSGSYLIDNDIYTYWHTQLTGFPHWVVVDLGNSYFVNDIQFVRRQDDGGNGQWAPTKIQLMYSQDGVNFTDIGTYAFDNTKVYGHDYPFAQIYGRYIKFVGISGGQPWMHMAEMSVFYK
ncbi:MAG: discoidin domain-containing protein [Bacteroidota bacterium]|nr:discoidin domain-containing protein [Bacteroidota bacterium]MDP4268543.1 discoidin domain-containing protein [Bacteroidota bacterium]